MYNRKTAFVLTSLITVLALTVFSQAQEPPPEPDMEVNIPDRIGKGVPFSINVSAQNNGGKAGRLSTISISTPNSSQLEEHHSLSFGSTQPSTKNAGAKVYAKNGSTIEAEDKLYELSADWKSGEKHFYNLAFVPKETGTVKFKVRTTLTDNKNTDEKYTAPSYSQSSDQQGYNVEIYTVKVTENYNRIDSFVAGAEYGDACLGNYTDRTVCKTQEEYWVEYTLGQTASGVLVYGDVRDVIVNVERRDTVNAGLAFIGLGLGAGDLAKSSVKAGSKASKHGDELSRITSKTGKLSKADKIKNLDEIYGGSATYLKKNGLSDDKIIGFSKEATEEFNIKRLEELVKSTDGKAADVLNKLDPDEAKRLLRLPDQASRQLVENLDEFRYVNDFSHGVEVLGKRHGVLIEARYIDDSEDFLKSVEDLGNVKKVDDLSPGQLGEAIAEKRVRDIAKKTGKEPEAVIREGYDGNVHSKGIDIIYKDSDTGELVVEEVKFSSSTGNVGKSDLGTTQNGGVYQLSNDYMENIVDNRRGISKSLADEIDTARAKGNLRKELTQIQNRPQDGKTIVSSVNSEDVKLDKINLIKTGKVRE